MADPCFFAASGPFTVQRLSEVAGTTVGNSGQLETVYSDVSPLGTAGPEHVSFLDNPRYIESFAMSRAGACVVRPEHAEKAPAGMALLLTDDPYRAYARIAALFHPLPTPRAGLDPTAVIDETAVIDPSCRVDAGAVVGPGATIGPRCHLSAHAVIGPNVVLGSDCIVGPSAALVYAIIGARVVIHTGVRIGQDGFGFALGAEGHLKVPQLGRVVIGDDVEIGANTTIDRGTGPDTVIGAGTKIDNLVQIAHNVRLGRGCVVVAQVGISGSTTVGDFAMIGGQAGLTGHLDIGAGARIAAQAGVMADVDPGAAVGGSPSRPIREWMRGVAIVQRMVRKRRGG